MKWVHQRKCKLTGRLRVVRHNSLQEDSLSKWWGIQTSCDDVHHLNYSNLVIKHKYDMPIIYPCIENKWRKPTWRNLLWYMKQGSRVYACRWKRGITGLKQASWSWPHSSCSDTETWFSNISSLFSSTNTGITTLFIYIKLSTIILLVFAKPALYNAWLYV